MVICVGAWYHTNQVNLTPSGRTLTLWFGLVGGQLVRGYFAAVGCCGTSIIRAEYSVHRDLNMLQELLVLSGRIIYGNRKRSYVAANLSMNA